MVKKTLLKSILLLFLFTFFNTAVYADIKFQLNKVTGFIMFSEAIIGVKHRPDVYKKIYNKKFKNNKDMEQLRGYLSKLYKHIRTTRILNHETTNNLLSAIIIETSFVKSLDELENRFTKKYKSRIDDQLLKNYFMVLKKFYPIYEKLIWNKNIKKLEASKRQVEKLLREVNIDEIIGNVAGFYGLKESEVRTLYVNMYPLPNAKSFQALRIENSAPVGIIIKPGPLNLKWFLSSVILHEYNHEIFAVKKKKIIIMAHMLDPKLKKDRKFVRTFDESMQTAIAAGYIYNKLSKQLFKGPWYNNKTYDLMAKSLYLEIDEYLRLKKPIDRAFMEKSILIYSKIK